MFTSSLTKQINVCKILITLPTCQPSNLASISEYNMTNYLDFLLDKRKKDINWAVSNNGKEEIRSTDIDNNEKDIKLADIEKQRLASSNWIPENRMLSKLSSTFKEVTFNKSEFSTGILVLDTRYLHLKSQNNNPFYLLNDYFDYRLTH